MVLRFGIDVGGTKIEAVALDGSLERARIRVPTPRNDYDATINAVVDVTTELERRTGASGTVGVGIPGTISPSTGFVKNANSVWLIGRALQADLSERLGREVRVANDANCFTISEAVDGAAAGAAVVFGAILGTGTGAGIVVHGNVLTGANAIAGEWGHNPMPWPGADDQPVATCYCGKPGCIETYLSGPAFATEYERHTGRRCEVPEIVARASSGDRAADEVMNRYCSRAARAFATVINVLDPDVIVLGGGVSNIQALYDQIPRLWGSWVFCAGAPEVVRTRLVRAKHGDSSGVRGAAWLWGDA